MSAVWRAMNIRAQKYGQCFSQSFGVLKQSTAMNAIPGNPTTNSITSKLNENLKPEYLEVINESYMHNVPKGSETHFKVVVVSKDFEDIPLIKRHRIVNELLKDELAGGVHALSIIAKSPSQWEKSDKKVDQSPACRGGFGK